ncbi:MAG: alpha/beta hydrolase [Rikenellaceae bacterium]
MRNIKLKIVVNTILLALATSSLHAQYVPDMLGDGYESLTLEMKDDSKGEVIATLVRRYQPEQTKRAILYIHGYNDYFFQKEMGDRFSDSLWNFYALDLRRYGRSMLDSREPFEITDLSEYFEDIDAALSQIIFEGSCEIVLMGHSTGGLITSLYCNETDKQIDGLIINSPFFDMNMSWFEESVAVPLISIAARWFGDITVQSPSDVVGNYAKSIHSQFYGEWNFDTSLKSLSDKRITSGWMRAIHTGHTTIQSGMDIKCPVLLLYSDKSIKGGVWSEDFQCADAVLDVEDIKKYGDNIGENVEKVEIKDGLHDLVLSKLDVRENAYFQIFKWLSEIGL